MLLLDERKVEYEVRRVSSTRSSLPNYFIFFYTSSLFRYDVHHSGHVCTRSCCRCSHSTLLVSHFHARQLHTHKFSSHTHITFSVSPSPTPLPSPSPGSWRRRRELRRGLRHHGLGRRWYLVHHDHAKLVRPPSSRLSGLCRTSRTST